MDLYNYFADAQDYLGWHYNAKRLREKKVHWVWFIPSNLFFALYFIINYIKDGRTHTINCDCNKENIIS